MNTPQPCSSCKYCKWDVINKEDPAYCIPPTNKKVIWGDVKCPSYEEDKTNG